MGLKKSVLTEVEETPALSTQDILALLQSDNRDLRRQGAREAQNTPELVGELCTLAQTETCFDVREAIFSSLQKVGMLTLLNL